MTANKANGIQQIEISAYSYDLPDNRIAKHPLEQRDCSKLLRYKNGTIEESVFYQLPEYLPEKAMLVYNNTKVIQARLIFHKPTGARIEIFCLEPLNPSDYALAFQATRKASWKCIIGNAKKWKSGVLTMPFFVGDKEYYLYAERVEGNSDANEVLFSWDCEQLTFSEVLEQTGKIPIPPYLNRETEDSDVVRYQTVYSKFEGSVAAPTAGLHFTDDVFAAIDKKNIERCELTLHVGAGTFKPVKSETIGGHDMHTEHIQVTADSLRKLAGAEGAVIAVGTTSVRTLESLYWLGVKIKHKCSSVTELKQWEAYELPNDYSLQEAFAAIADYMDENNLVLFNAATQIIIAPGYQFKVIDGLVTNFHQPQSTLLLLISALVGDDWHKIYDYALNNDFRFLSYGDSSLLMKSKV